MVQSPEKDDSISQIKRGMTIEQQPNNSSQDSSYVNPICHDPTWSVNDKYNNSPGGPNNAAPLFFGGKIVSDRVFLRRRYVFAMVNDRQVNDRLVADGHVFICPVRQVRSMRDLTELEYLELFTCAREVTIKF